MMDNWTALQEAYFLGLTNGAMDEVRVHGVDWKTLGPSERAERLAAAAFKVQVEQREKLDAVGNELLRAVAFIEADQRETIREARNAKRWAIVLAFAVGLILTFRHL